LQIKDCRDHDGSLIAERNGIDHRVCKKWLDVVNSVAKDFAVWEQADIKYHGRRHDDEDDETLVDEFHELDETDDEQDSDLDETGPI